MTLSFISKIGNEQILCTSSPSSWQDVDTIVDFAFKQAHAKGSPNAGTVALLDIPPTLFLTVAVKKLLAAGFNVEVRDHHDLEQASPTKSHELKIGATRIRETLGAKAVIRSRAQNLSCASLIAPGEFKEAVAIITDADFDGWLSAMKALGVMYDELDRDAIVLDGPWSHRHSGSEISRFLIKAYYTLPAFGFDAQAFRRGYADLLTRFAAACGGDEIAQESFLTVTGDWERTALRATELSKKAIEIAPGAWFAEAAFEPRFDLGVLMSILESREGCRVIAIHRDEGMVAEFFGTQITVTLAPAEHKATSLLSLLPAGLESCAAQEGVYSNSAYSLELSEVKWQLFLPELRAYLAKSQVVASPSGIRTPTVSLPQ